MKKTITILTDYLGLGKIDMKIGDVIIIGILIISSFIPLFFLLLRRGTKELLNMLLFELMARK